MCEIRPDKDMPKDEFGNVADIVQFGGSPIARMNIGQEYERYINAACRDVSKDVRVMVNKGPDGWREAWEHAMGFLAILSPKQHAHYLKVKTSDTQKRAFIEGVCKDILRAYVAPDAPEGGKELIKAIMTYRRPDKGPITYTNYDGRVTVTKSPMLIGPKQMIVLDKSSFKPMAVSVAQRQNHGLLATTNKRTKVAHPTNRQPPRSWGESEIRNLCSSMGGEEVSYIVDLSTNPEAMRSALRHAMMSASPFKEYAHLDRRIHPAGQGRTIQFVKNLLCCMGAEMVTTKDPIVQNQVINAANTGA